MRVLRARSHLPDATQALGFCGVTSVHFRDGSSCPRSVHSVAAASPHSPGVDSGPVSWSKEKVNLLYLAS